MAKFDVDFPHVRKHADITAVLAHYNVELIGDGEQRKGTCPFHEDERPSLSVNVERNVWNCQRCGSGGNVIKLVQLLDEELKNPRKAALQIAKLSGIAAKPNGTVPKTTSVEAGKPAHETAEVVSETGTEEETVEDGVPVNRPLTFALQLAPVESGGATAANRFIEEHGLPYERVAELGIGVGQRGSMKNRLAIPIRNVDGELVAYSGCDVGLLEEGNSEKYKYPPKFNRGLELYGWHEAQNFERIVLVESFWPVIKHGGVAARDSEHGFGIAALMGTQITEAQIELLLQTCPAVVLCLAGDTGEEKAAASIAGSLAASGLWVTVRRCSGGKPPEDIDSEAFCRACSAE